MNLHEECLLKYLLNPKDLSTVTELLKLNNELIKNNKFKITSANLKYNVTVMA